MFGRLSSRTSVCVANFTDVVNSAMGVCKHHRRETSRHFGRQTANVSNNCLWNNYYCTSKCVYARDLNIGLHAETKSSMSLPSFLFRIGRFMVLRPSVVRRRSVHNINVWIVEQCPPSLRTNKKYTALSSIGSERSNRCTPVKTSDAIVIPAVVDDPSLFDV